MQGEKAEGVILSGARNETLPCSTADSCRRRKDMTLRGSIFILSAHSDDDDGDVSPVQCRSLNVPACEQTYILLLSASLWPTVTSEQQQNHPPESHDHSSTSQATHFDQLWAQMCRWVRGMLRGTCVASVTSQWRLLPFKFKQRVKTAVKSVTRYWQTDELQTVWTVQCGQVLTDLTTRLAQIYKHYFLKKKRFLKFKFFMW